MHFRTLFAVGLGLVLGGCQLQLPKLPDFSRLLDFSSETTVKPLADGFFQVEIPSGRVKGLGGPGSATLASYVDQEVTKSGLCKGGTRVLAEWWGNGYYGIKGQCK